MSNRRTKNPTSFYLREYRPQTASPSDSYSVTRGGMIGHVPFLSLKSMVLY